MAGLKSLILALFFLLELAALAAYSYGGFHLGAGRALRIAAGIGAPIAVAVFWGAFVAPKASVPVPATVRFLLQAVVFLGAALSLRAAGQPVWAFGFLIGAAVLMTLVYSLKL